MELPRLTRKRCKTERVPFKLFPKDCIFLGREASALVLVILGLQDPDEELWVKLFEECRVSLLLHVVERGVLDGSHLLEHRLEGRLDGFR